MTTPYRFYSGLCCSLLLALTLAGCSDDTNSPSEPEIAKFSMTPEAIKTFHFSWPAEAGADHYKLLETRDDTLTPIVRGELSQTDADASNLLHMRLTVALYDQKTSRYLVQSCDSTDHCVDGAVLPIVNNPSLNNLVGAIGYVKASNTGKGDGFGYSVSLNQDGTVMAIGAPYEDSADTGISAYKTGADDATVIDSGAVYVFIKDSIGHWQQHVYIKASNAGEGDYFGYSVSLNAEGTLLAVGATYEDSLDTGVRSDQKNPDESSNSNSGAVYLFERDKAAGWKQQAYIKASNTGAGDKFGNSISLSQDGRVLAVGAYLEASNRQGISGGEQLDDNNDASYSGAVYLFERDKNATAGWKQQAYVKASNTGENDFFGTSVSLNQNGTVLAVGASGESSSAQGVFDKTGSENNNSGNSGAVYVFEQSEYIGDSAGWKQQAYIKASNTGSNDQFGTSVSLNQEGTLLAVGAPFEDNLVQGVFDEQPINDNAKARSGAVYLFGKDKTQGWQAQAYIKASNTGEDDTFGSSVSLSDNGQHLVVGATLSLGSGESGGASGLNGANNDEVRNSGAAYSYLYRDGQWQFESYIKASNTEVPTQGKIDGDRFGHALALSGDGQTLAVGSPGEDSNGKGVGGYDLDEGDAAHSEDYNPQADNSMENAGAVYLY